MLETPHSILGAAVGAATGNPYLAAPAGVASHFATDVMPHWNPNFPFKSKLLYAAVIMDFVVAELLVVIFYVLFPERPEIAIGAFFGTLPDLILGIRFTFNVRWLSGYQRMHGFLHHEVGPLAGIPPQIIVSLLSAYYLTTV